MKESIELKRAVMRSISGAPELTTAQLRGHAPTVGLGVRGIKVMSHKDSMRLHSAEMAGLGEGSVRDEASLGDDVGNLADVLGSSVEPAEIPGGSFSFDTSSMCDLSGLEMQHAFDDGTASDSGGAASSTQQSSATPGRLVGLAGTASPALPVSKAPRTLPRPDKERFKDDRVLPRNPPAQTTRTTATPKQSTAPSDAAPKAGGPLPPYRNAPGHRWPAAQLAALRDQAP